MMIIRAHTIAFLLNKIDMKIDKLFVLPSGNTYCQLSLLSYFKMYSPMRRAELELVATTMVDSDMIQSSFSRKTNKQKIHFIYLSVCVCVFTISLVVLCSNMFELSRHSSQWALINSDEVGMVN
jgi:hypothetical protein